MLGDPYVTSCAMPRIFAGVAAAAAAAANVGPSESWLAYKKRD
jgi:hypothetical protein